MIGKAIGVYGASGFGREVLPLIKTTNDLGDSEIFFIDDNPKSSIINSISVVSYNDFLKIEARQKTVVVAIADAKVRKKIERKCINDSIEIFSVKASNVVIMDDVVIEHGFILCPFVTLTSNIKIGKSFHANIYSYVAHDCEIGDYVTFAPSVHCNGNVKIEDDVYVGTGAIIKQGKPGAPIVIGKGATIGMGAVVTKSVEPGAVVIGNPARPFQKLVV